MKASSLRRLCHRLSSSSPRITILEGRSVPFVLQEETMMARELHFCLQLLAQSGAIKLISRATCKSFSFLERNKDYMEAQLTQVGVFRITGIPDIQLKAFNVIGQLREDDADIVLMVDADMIGYRSPSEPAQVGLPAHGMPGTPEVSWLVGNLTGIYSPNLKVGYTPVRSLFDPVSYVLASSVAQACCSDHQVRPRLYLAC
jgi:hypothetical protein